MGAQEFSDVRLPKLCIREGEIKHDPTVSDPVIEGVGRYQITEKEGVVLKVINLLYHLPLPFSAKPCP